jgi:hypothetical protein
MVIHNSFTVMPLSFLELIHLNFGRMPVLSYTLRALIEMLYNSYPELHYSFPLQTHRPRIVVSHLTPIYTQNESTVGNPRVQIRSA